MKKIQTLLVACIFSASTSFCMQRSEVLKRIDENLELSSKVKAQQEPDFTWLPDKISVIIKNSDINSADDLGNTRLHYAAFLKSFPSMDLLLSLGADPAKGNAHEQDFLTILALLIDQEKDKVKRNELISGYQQLLQLIAKNNVQQLFHDGSNLLHQAVVMQDAAFVANLLVSNALNPSHPDKQGSTPLHLAAGYSAGDPTILNQLLYHRANTNAQTELGNTPLHGATKYFIGNGLPIKQLLQYGASPDIQNNNWDTPIHSMLQKIQELIKEYTQLKKSNAATKNEKFETLKNAAIALFDILQYSKNKNIQDNFGNSALYHLVLLSDSPEPEVKTLLKPLIETIFNDKQANPNTQNRDGFTPLHAAVGQQDLGLMTLLLERGANPYIKSYTRPRTIAEVRSGLVPPPNKTPREMAQEIKKGISEKQDLPILEIQLALLKSEKANGHLAGIAQALEQLQAPTKPKSLYPKPIDQKPTPKLSEPAPTPQEPSPVQPKKGASALETALRDLTLSLQKLRRELL